MKLKLCLVAIKTFVGKEGDQKRKLIFISETDKPYVGYADPEQITPEIEALVVDTNTFNPERARAWEVTQDVYGDKLTYRVVVPPLGGVGTQY